MYENFDFCVVLTLELIIIKCFIDDDSDSFLQNSALDHPLIISLYSEHIQHTLFGAAS